MSGVECPIASFVRGLKTFETRHCIGGDGATCSGTMIVAFNKNRLTDVCYSNSPNYNPSLCDFDLIASEIFKGDETWVNRGLVKEVIDLLAKLHGIHEACKDGHKMIYSVSFLNNKAQPDKKLWITTDAMNSVITHTKKKIKFVYVETIFNKPGWVPLQKGDCCAVGVSNDGAVGFCNDGNNGSSDSDDGSDDEKVDHATVADNSKSAASKRKSRVSSIDFADEVHGEERMPKRATAIEGQSYANAAIESRGMMDVQKESV